MLTCALPCDDASSLPLEVVAHEQGDILHRCLSLVTARFAMVSPFSV